MISYINTSFSFISIFLEELIVLVKIVMGGRGTKDATVLETGSYCPQDSEVRNGQDSGSVSLVSGLST